MLVYEYDALGVTTRVLPAGALFQPWEPLAHQRGARVPITFGEGALRFDWGVSSTSSRSRRPSPSSPRSARACAPPRRRPARAELDELLGVLARLEAAHARAAEMQRAAEGFDNTETARRCDDVQTRLLAAAREVLRAARSLL